MGPKPPENINEIVARKAPGNRSVVRAQKRNLAPRFQNTLAATGPL